MTFYFRKAAARRNGVNIQVFKTSQLDRKSLIKSNTGCLKKLNSEK